MEKLSASTKVLKSEASDDFPIPSVNMVEKLNELATSSLAEIIRQHSTGQSGWSGYEEAEIIAARELLDRDAQRASR